MKHLRKAAALVCALVLCLGLLPCAVTAADGRYEDVPASHWAYESVETVSESRLMQGYGDGRFGPADRLTIAQVAQILCNAREEETAPANGFWAYGAVERCRDVLKCLPDLGAITAENYDVPVSRELAVYMLVNGYGVREDQSARRVVLSDLPDGDEITPAYRDAVLAAYRSRLVLGVDSTGAFNPKGLLTRAEGAALFARATAPAAYAGPYLTFRSGEPFTLATANGRKNWNGVLEYSTDAKNWTEWDGKTIRSGAIGDVLYLRGRGNRVITGPSEGKSSAADKSETPKSYDKMWVLTGRGVSCSGNIETLLDHEAVEAGRHPTMRKACFRNLFMGCTALTTPPALPATTLAEECYSSMFGGCANLKTAPALPAAMLEKSCYSGMFSGCAALKTAPELPATRLAEYCCQFMFSSCKSLTAAPELPAETMEDACYYRMFSGCTALTAAPALPADKLESRCYYEMFSGCTALSSAPALPAEKMSIACYAGMFSGCTALKTAPELPAERVEAGCYRGMFADCTALSAAPALPATTLVNTCYKEMFRGCRMLETLPALPAEELAYDCYTGMFSGCVRVRLSETQTAEYTVPYRIPAAGEGTARFDCVTDMFARTGGTFTGTPAINTTYYLHESNSVAG